MPATAIVRAQTTLILASVLASALPLALPRPALAGIDSCLAVAFEGADPNDLAHAARFVESHGSCLGDLVPPEPLVPYAALSGAMDAANQSGALAKVGLDFGDDYSRCTAKFDLGKVTVKQLEPVLRPICKTIHLDCGIFESEAANQVDPQLESQVPLLGLLPCACAAATSGLGVEKIAKLASHAESCGKSLGQAAGYVAKAAGQVYDTGKGIVEGVGCAFESLFGSCGGGGGPITNLLTATALGQAWCTPYGGVQSLVSPTDGPDNFLVTCNDGSMLNVKPGKQSWSMTAAQKRQRAAQIALINAQVSAANVLWCETQRGRWRAQYEPRCHDEKCRQAVESILNRYIADILRSSKGGPDAPGPPVAVKAADLAKRYLGEISGAVDQSIIRDPASGIESVMSAYGCRRYLGRDLQELCPTQAGYQACKGYVDRNQMVACLQEDVPGSKYANRLLYDPTADPAVRMALYGCKNFLGRPSEKLCAQEKGFQICKEAAGKGLVKKCLDSRTREIYVAQLQVAARPDAPPETWLPEHGCENFLGRKGQWLCTDESGYNTCLQYLRVNGVETCAAPHYPRRISAQHLAAELVKWDCVKAARPQSGPLRPGDHYYACRDASGLAGCEKAKADDQAPATVHCEVARLPLQRLPPARASRPLQLHE